MLATSASMASSNLRAGRVRSQAETGEGRTQCTDPATEDPGVGLSEKAG